MFNEVMFVLMFVNVVLTIVTYWIFNLDYKADGLPLTVVKVWLCLVVFTVVEYLVLTSTLVTKLAQRLKRYIMSKLVGLALQAVGIHLQPNRDIMQSTLDVSGKFMIIRYFFDHKWHQVVMPYNNNRRIRMKMASHTVKLMLENNQSIDISTQPGIPYLASAQQLGGVAIQSYNSAATSSDSSTYSYYAYEIPGYLDSAH